MAVYTFIEVACDVEECERAEDMAGPYPSVGEARRDLVKQGWRWTREWHLCPDHRDHPVALHGLRTVRGLARRLLDRWRHPGEYTRQREFRRWRASLEAHAPSSGPYVLSTIKEVGPKDG